MMNSAGVPAAGHDAAWWRPPPAAERTERSALPESTVAQSALPFWGLVAFTVILLVSPQAIVPALGPLRIALVTAAVAGLALVTDRLRRGQPLSIRTRHLTLALILAAWAVATVPFSLWPGGSVHALLGLYAKSLVLFWLLANVLTTADRLRRLAWALAVLTIPIALAAVRDFVSGGFLPNSQGRIAGYDAPLTSNPNDLALMLNLLIPLIVALLLGRPTRGGRLFLLAALGLNVIAVIATFSRAGFLTLIAVAVAYAWKLRGRPERRWIGLALVVAIVCLPLLPSGYGNRLSTIVQADEDHTGSAQARSADSVAALQVIARHPVAGVGFGMDVLALNRERGERWTAVHNVYLQHAVDLGLPGAVLFVMLFGACLGSARRIERVAAGRPEMRQFEALAGGIHVSLIAYAVAALFHPVSYHFYFYYIAGMAVALEVIARTSGLLPGRAGA